MYKLKYFYSGTKNNHLIHLNRESKCFSKTHPESCTLKHKSFDFFSFPHYIPFLSSFRILFILFTSFVPIIIHRQYSQSLNMFLIIKNTCVCKCFENFSAIVRNTLMITSEEIRSTTELTFLTLYAIKY